MDRAAWEHAMSILVAAAMTENVHVGDHPLTVCVARTPAERATGLAGVDLAGRDGMLFDFEEDSTDPFHMRGMSDPLDIAWFDSEGVCVGVTTMQVEQVFHPPTVYRYALEVAAGRMEKMGVKPGVKLRRRKSY